MKIITLPPYGVGSSEVHLAVGQIVSFYGINYNRLSGTEIVLMNGKKCLTSMSDWNLKKLLEGLE